MRGAIQRLLDGFGGMEFDGEEIVAIEDATRDEHLIPYVPFERFDEITAALLR